ncbi:uncharacterized protein PB18E9.04c-like [Rhincodon typus]|uniref:uncharacterized protein PB18E9.04c-like n=1 Tax=Rhincodon typus TaxID=259920 RepID=UPI00202F3645|nr:uncharacterized protein PB18E9.04c-like [Rhincodon typus]
MQISLTLMLVFSCNCLAVSSIMFAPRQHSKGPSQELMSSHPKKHAETTMKHRPQRSMLPSVPTKRILMHQPTVKERVPKDLRRFSRDSGTLGDIIFDFYVKNATMPLYLENMLEDTGDLMNNIAKEEHLQSIFDQSEHSDPYVTQNNGNMNGDSLPYLNIETLGIDLDPVDSADFHHASSDVERELQLFYQMFEDYLRFKAHRSQKERSDIRNKIETTCEKILNKKGSKEVSWKENQVAVTRKSEGISSYSPEQTTNGYSQTEKSTALIQKNISKQEKEFSSFESLVKTMLNAFPNPSKESPMQKKETEYIHNQLKPGFSMKESIIIQSVEHINDAIPTAKFSQTLSTLTKSTGNRSQKFDSHAPSTAPQKDYFSVSAKRPQKNEFSMLTTVSQPENLYKSNTVPQQDTFLMSTTEPQHNGFFMSNTAPQQNNFFTSTTEPQHNEFSMSTTIPQKGNFSMSAPVPQKGNSSMSAPVPQKGNSSMSAPVPQKGHFSMSAPVPQKGNFSMSVSVPQKGNFSTSAPVPQKGSHIHGLPTSNKPSHKQGSGTSSELSPKHGSLYPTKQPQKHGSPTPTKVSQKHGLPTATKVSQKHGSPTPTKVSQKHGSPTPTKVSQKHGSPTTSKSHQKHVSPTPTKVSQKHGSPSTTKSPQKHGSPTATKASQKHGSTTITKTPQRYDLHTLTSQSQKHGSSTVSKPSQRHGSPTTTKVFQKHSSHSPDTSHNVTMDDINTALNLLQTGGHHPLKKSQSLSMNATEINRQIHPKNDSITENTRTIHHKGLLRSLIIPEGDLDHQHTFNPTLIIEQVSSTPSDNQLSLGQQYKVVRLAQQDNQELPQGLSEITKNSDIPSVENLMKDLDKQFSKRKPTKNDINNIKAALDQLNLILSKSENSEETSQSTTKEVTPKRKPFKRKQTPTQSKQSQGLINEMNKGSVRGLFTHNGSLKYDHAEQKRELSNRETQSNIVSSSLDSQNILGQKQVTGELKQSNNLFRGLPNSASEHPNVHQLEKLLIETKKEFSQRNPTENDVG